MTDEPVDLMANLLASLGLENPTPTYTPPAADRVPMERWGRDHWSTLAYIETRIVDHRGRIEHDHMRCDVNRHPQMFAAKRRGLLLGTLPGQRKYPTMLRGNVELPDHDDYDCLDDMIAAGLVEAHMPPPPAGTLITGLVESEMMTRATFTLTGAGQAMAARLREHKGSGGSWASFVPGVPA